MQASQRHDLDIPMPLLPLLVEIYVINLAIVMHKVQKVAIREGVAKSRL